MPRSGAAGCSGANGERRVFSFPCSSWHGIPGAVPGQGDQGPAGCHRLGTALDEHCTGAEPGAPSPCTLRDVPVPPVQHRDLQVGPGVLEGKLRSESRSSAESKSAPSHPQNECLAAWFSVRWDGGEGAARPLGFSQRRSPWCVFPPPGRLVAVLAQEPSCRGTGSTSQQRGPSGVSTSSLQQPRLRVLGKALALCTGHGELVPSPRPAPPVPFGSPTPQPGCLFLPLLGCESLHSLVSVTAFEGIYKPRSSPLRLL